MIIEISWAPSTLKTMRWSTILVVVIIAAIAIGIIFWAAGRANNYSVIPNTPGTPSTGVASSSSFGAYSSSSASATTSHSNTGASAATATASTRSPSAAAPRAGTSSRGNTLETASDPALGPYLIAANGMTLYRYTNDSTDTSNCYGQCATLWPPYAVQSSQGLTDANGVAGRIGTITRRDGSLQLTYNGQPLYFWYGDSKPGDTKGEGVGNVWFVVYP